MQFLNRFIADENGATSIEYAVIAGFISISIAVAATAIGGQLVPIFDDIAKHLGE